MWRLAPVMTVLFVVVLGIGELPDERSVSRSGDVQIEYEQGDGNGEGPSLNASTRPLPTASVPSQASDATREAAAGDLYWLSALHGLGHQLGEVLSADLTGGAANDLAV